MSIEKTWGEINEGEDEDLSSLLQPNSLSKRPSNNPLEKIKKNLLINIIWAIVISTGYILIIGFFHIWQVQVSLGVVLAFTLWQPATHGFNTKKSIQWLPPPAACWMN